ncbi:hypothetical protein [Subtercola lobariae]|uniref:HIRAN domain-containing protein n=1 Tax=Subtercola lobariae TaxID=1588641 RepID=A0A917BCT4_9MICO|nr:hypothetical protein [Subtercola lobariae]GGF35500.1 hypothetical protein GCM10011399_30640 [Subtercola lobariae]
MTTSSTEPAPFGKKDVGSGKLADYRFNMLPKNTKVTLQLAGSDPFQDVISDAQGRIGSRGDLQAFVARCTADEERTDAPIAVRFFIDSRMTGVVGWVPRGLEAAVIDTLTRLETAGRTPRIPAAIVKTRHGLRVDLLLGLTR